MTRSLRSAFVLLALAAGGCVARPPTIAHVHLGHALTAVHVTPNREGYLLIAERQAAEAHALAQRAHQASDLETLKTHASAAVAASADETAFGLKQSVILAANHISFAATAPDASSNVQQSAPEFTRDITRIVERCELIALLGKDIAASRSAAEASLFAEEILDLTAANLQGDDADGDGAAGSSRAEYGVRQLRAQFDRMIAREDPPYRTVDQWYLFNLVRLPNGRWVFDKLGRGGNIDGYR